MAGVVIVALVVAGTFLFYKSYIDPPESGPVSPAQVNIGDAEFGGAFTLTDHTGARVSADELIDGPTLIYFGYTYCPDVCPVDVANMAETADRLAERGVEVTPVFVSIDPARDDPESLSYYVEGMHPEMVGLTGSEDEIKKVAEKFNVYYQRVELEDSAAGYLMDHTTFTYLLTPEGVEAVFRNGHPPEEIAGAVEQILSRG